MSADGCDIPLETRPRSASNIEDLRVKSAFRESQLTTDLPASLASLALATTVDQAPSTSSVDSKLRWANFVHRVQPTSSGKLADFVYESMPQLHVNKEKAVSHSVSPIDRYHYKLNITQLKETGNTSALLAGFGMVCLVEINYSTSMPHFILVVFAIVTALLVRANIFYKVLLQVSVHTISLMLSTCMIPHIEASGCRRDCPHVRLQLYIKLSWFFSTCLGLALFLIEVAVIFFVQFLSINFPLAAYCGAAVLLPALAAILFFSCHFYRILRIEQLEKLDGMSQDLHAYLGHVEQRKANLEMNKSPPNIV